MGAAFLLATGWQGMSLPEINARTPSGEKHTLPSLTLLIAARALPSGANPISVTENPRRAHSTQSKAAAAVLARVGRKPCRPSLPALRGRNAVAGGGRRKKGQARCAALLLVLVIAKPTFARPSRANLCAAHPRPCARLSRPYRLMSRFPGDRIHRRRGFRSSSRCQSATVRR